MPLGYCDECGRMYVYSSSDDAICHGCQNELSDPPEEETNGWVRISRIEEEEREAVA